MEEILRVWVYARCGVCSPQTLYRQVLDVIQYATAQGWLTVGTSQQLEPGRGQFNAALTQALKIIEDGKADALAMYDLNRISYDPDVQYLVLCFLQDHDAVIVTTGVDLRQELACNGLDQALSQRSRKTGHPVPWLAFEGGEQT